MISVRLSGERDATPDVFVLSPDSDFFIDRVMLGSRCRDAGPPRRHFAAARSSAAAFAAACPDYVIISRSLTWGILGLPRIPVTCRRR